MRKAFIVGALACLAVFFAVGGAGASTPGADARLTNDCHPLAGCGAGYVSAYTLATGNAYTDATLGECTISRGRQNEPAVAVDPRNTSVLLGSSNEIQPVREAPAAYSPLRSGAGGESVRMSFRAEPSVSASWNAGGERKRVIPSSPLLVASPWIAIQVSRQEA